MKTLAAFALLITGCVGPTSGTARHAQSGDAGGVEAVKQVAQDMGTAMVSSDADALARIYADDFVSIGMSGKTSTKQDLLSTFSLDHKLLWFQLGPTDAQVFGHVAVSQGSVQEKRLLDGKETSGEFAWMDLLENRNGRWLVVRSAGARITGADAPRSPNQDPAAADTIAQLEKRTGDAMVAFDVDTLGQIYADDWLTVRSNGSTCDKASLLSDFTSRKHQLLSFELGHMKVQVLGDVALAQASVTEKRVQDGKDISGEFVFMDLLERRAGKWMIVRTLGTRVS
jgi:ketosteroid isomerase-like protein